MPESLREIGVVGRGGKCPEEGESDEGGLESLLVELVVGRSYCFWFSLALEKALKISGCGANAELFSPNAAELRPAYLASDVDGVLLLNIDGFSDEKVSKGKVSMA